MESDASSTIHPGNRASLMSYSDSFSSIVTKESYSLKA